MDQYPLLRTIAHATLCLDPVEISTTANALRWLQRSRNRLFIIGNGGGAGHASHAVNDFRKISGIDALTFENMSELTARVNDDSWRVAWRDWLHTSRFSMRDVLMVFSVGGGTENVSVNLTIAMQYAQDVGGTVIGIVGQGDGYAQKFGRCIVIPSKATPVVESLQATVWHLLVEELRNPRMRL